MTTTVLPREGCVTDPPSFRLLAFPSFLSVSWKSNQLTLILKLMSVMHPRRPKSKLASLQEQASVRSLVPSCKLTSFDLLLTWLSGLASLRMCQMEENGDGQTGKKKKYHASFFKIVGYKQHGNIKLKSFPLNGRTWVLRP